MAAVITGVVILPNVVLENLNIILSFALVAVNVIPERTPWIKGVLSVWPSNATKSIVPSSFIYLVVVNATNPSSTVDPEKNPLSSASLLTNPFINWTLFPNVLKGWIKLPSGSSKNERK